MLGTFGHHVLLRRLATTPFANVFLARCRHDADLGKVCVLRVLHHEIVQQAHFVDSLREEMSLALQLHHPNVVPVFDVGRARGRWYVTAAFVDGPNLDVLSRRLHRRLEPRPLLVASLYIVRELLCALLYCHRRASQVTALEETYRELTPGNVLVSRDGAVMLSDFGLALSPHRRRRRRHSVRDDIRGAGALLHLLLTGQRRRDTASGTGPRHGLPRAEQEVVDSILKPATSRNPEPQYRSVAGFHAAVGQSLLALDPRFEQEDLRALLARVFDRRSPQRDRAHNPGVIGSQHSSDNEPTVVGLRPLCPVVTLTSADERAPDDPEDDVTAELEDQDVIEVFDLDRRAPCPARVASSAYTVSSDGRLQRIRLINGSPG